MPEIKSYQKKKLLVLIAIVLLLLTGLLFRVIWLVETGENFNRKAIAVEQRERSVKAERGTIYDRNGIVLADNLQVCTISVIHSQVTDSETAAKSLAELLDMTYEDLLEKINKNTSIEIIKTNVSKELGEKIKALKLDGIKVDTDYLRYYPYPTIMSKLLGFTGSENQGIVGLEVYYNELLSGEDGTIYTYTDARGIELDTAEETRKEAVKGNSLYLTIDYNIQKYINSVAEDTLLATGSKTVSIIVMNPQNGEIYGMTTAPEYDNENPFVLSDGTKSTDMTLLNEMWRNQIVSDSYEPGSTFKIITATAALSLGSCSIQDSFNCSGSRQVGGRTIHCHKLAGHGTVTFADSLAQSCNCALMEIGSRVGAKGLYKYMEMLGLTTKTGIDLPGEATSILYNLEAVNEVELATMSFGQSLQITPLQLIRAVSCVINGGTLITPHVGLSIGDSNGNDYTELTYEESSNIIDKQISETMQELLLNVVANGTGANAAVEGYLIGGKTATSEKLPRSENKYIASYIGFAPADEPEVLIFVMIDEPQGAYYGGTIAAPVASKVFANILPYLN